MPISADFRWGAANGALTVRAPQELARARPTRVFAAVDLERVLLEAVELTRSRWQTEAQSRGTSYEIRMEGGRLPPVSGISEELREAFMSLLINALEAMSNGGRLICHFEGQADHVAVAAQGVRHGVSERIGEWIFAPLLTTRRPRKSGSGLSVAWEIVNCHGGTIGVEIASGRGSSFTVRLPIRRQNLQGMAIRLKEAEPIGSASPTGLPLPPEEIL